MLDYKSAVAEGYSDDEILEYLKGTRTDFDFDGAVGEGYSVPEIAQHVSSMPVAEPPQSSLGQPSPITVSRPANIAEPSTTKTSTTFEEPFEPTPVTPAGFTTKTVGKAFAKDVRRTGAGVISGIGYELQGESKKVPTYEELDENQRVMYDMGKSIVESGEKPVDATERGYVQYYKNLAVTKPQAEKIAGGIREKVLKPVGKKMIGAAEKIKGPTTPETQQTEQELQDAHEWLKHKDALNPKNIGKTVTAAATVAAESGATNLLSAVPVAGVAVPGLVEKTGWIDEAKASGLDDPDLLNKYGDVYGLLSGGIERLGGEILFTPVKGVMKGKVATKAFEKVVSDKAKGLIFKKVLKGIAGELGDVGIGALAEGGEEFTQAMLSDAMKYAAFVQAEKKHPDRAEFFRKQRDAIDLDKSVKSALEQAYFGAIGGGTIRGVTGVAAKGIGAIKGKQTEQPAIPSPTTPPQKPISEVEKDFSAMQYPKGGSSAESVGAEVEKGSGKEGPIGGEGGQVRLRDNAPFRVEAKPGEKVIEVETPEKRDRIAALADHLKFVKDKKERQAIVDNMTPEEAQEVLRRSPVEVAASAVPKATAEGISPEEADQIAAYAKEGRPLGGRKYKEGAIPETEKKQRYLELDLNKDMEEAGPQFEKQIEGVKFGGVQPGVAQPGKRFEPTMTFLDEYTGSNVNVTREGGLEELKKKIAEVRQADPEAVAKFIAGQVGGLEYVGSKPIIGQPKQGGAYTTENTYQFKTTDGIPVTINLGDTVERIKSYLKSKKGEAYAERTTVERPEGQAEAEALTKQLEPLTVTAPTPPKLHTRATDVILNRYIKKGLVEGKTATELHDNVIQLIDRAAPVDLAEASGITEDEAKAAASDIKAGKTTDAAIKVRTAITPRLLYNQTVDEVYKEITEPRDASGKVMFSKKEPMQQNAFGGEKSLSEIESEEKKRIERAEVKGRIQRRRGGEADMSGLPMFENQNIEGSQQTLFSKRYENPDQTDLFAQEVPGKSSKKQEVTVDDLIAAKDPEPVLTRLFGGITEDRFDALDEGESFKNSKEEVYYYLADRYKADLETAIKEGDHEETRRLYDNFKREFNDEISYQRGKSVRSGAPSTFAVHKLKDVKEVGFTRYAAGERFTYSIKTGTGYTEKNGEGEWTQETLSKLFGKEIARRMMRDEFSSGPRGKGIIPEGYIKAYLSGEDVRFSKKRKPSTRQLVEEYTPSPEEEKLTKAVYRSQGKVPTPGAIRIVEPNAEQQELKDVFEEEYHGKEVVWIDINEKQLIRDIGETYNGFMFRGATDPALKNKIFVNVNTDKPAIQIAYHELTHFIQQNPELNAAFWDAAKLTTKGKELVARRGRDEVMADIAGEMMADPEFQKALHDQNKSAFKAIFDKLLEILDRITKALTGRKDAKRYTQYVEDVEGLRDTLKGILREYGGEQVGGEQRMAASEKKDSDEIKKIIAVEKIKKDFWSGKIKVVAGWWSSEPHWVFDFNLQEIMKKYGVDHTTAFNTTYDFTKIPGSYGDQISFWGLYRNELQKELPEIGTDVTDELLNYLKQKRLEEGMSEIPDINIPDEKTTEKGIAEENRLSQINTVTMKLLRDAAKYEHEEIENNEEVKKFKADLYKKYGYKKTVNLGDFDKTYDVADLFKGQGWKVIQESKPIESQAAYIGSFQGGGVEESVFEKDNQKRYVYTLPERGDVDSFNFLNIITDKKLYGDEYLDLLHKVEDRSSWGSREEMSEEMTLPKLIKKIKNEMGGNQGAPEGFGMATPYWLISKEANMYKNSNLLDINEDNYNDKKNEFIQDKLDRIESRNAKYFSEKRSELNNILKKEKLQWEKWFDKKGKALISVAKKVRKELGIDNPDIRYSAREKADIFFSPLLKAVQNLKQQKGTGEQMFNMLTKAPGVKEAEWKWMGLDDFLKEKQSVTRQEIEDFVQENQVRVEEVNKNADAGYVVYQKFGTDGDEIREGPFKTASDAQDWIKENKQSFDKDSDFRIEKEGDTKYSQYQLPEGDNYREVLLTLPGDEGINAEERRLIDQIETEAEVIRQLEDSEDYSPEEKKAEMDASHKRAAKYREQLRAIPSIKKQDFKSSHWSEPNVIAHIRMNDREVSGEKILFIEEIQSDWAREIREAGGTVDDRKKIEPLIAEERKILEEKYPYKTDVRGDTREGGRIRKERFTEWLDRIPNEEKEKFVELRSKLSNVPNQPFLKNWEELTLKRILRLAAEEGYDRVAWINGEQTADRYDLSKQIDQVQAWKKTDGTYDLRVTKGGREVFTDSGLDGKKLTELVGKDLAEKIVTGKGAVKATGYTDKANNIDSIMEYSGLDLKMGGEWATNLYDKMIPKFYEKYGKKWGVKVEDVTFSGGLKEIQRENVFEELEKGNWIKLENNSASQEFTRAENLRRGIIEWDNEYGEDGYKFFYDPDFTNEKGDKLGKLTQQSIAITPEMRSFVLYEGQPMFSKKVTEADLPDLYEEAKGFNKKKSAKEIRKTYANKRIAGETARWLLRTTTGRLMDISPVIRDQVQKHVSRITLDTAKATRKILPLLNALKKMPSADYRVFDLAAKQADTEKINELAKQYGFEEALKAYRDTFNGLIKRLMAAGYETGYLKDYFPRMSKDRDAYRNFIRGTPEWGSIDEAIREKEKKIGRTMTDEEQEEFLDLYIRGYGDRMNAAKPGNLKERKVKLIDNDMNSLLEDTMVAIPLYVERMIKKAARKEFFDPQTKNTDLEINNIDDSIGEYVSQLIKDKKLDPRKQDELIGVLKSFFNYRPTNKSFAAIKNLGYMTTMGSGFSSMFSQMADAAFGFYTTGTGEIPAVAKALFGKTGLTVKDLGVDNVAGEFRDPGKIADAVDKLFKAVGIKWGDSIFKNAFLEANLRKYQRMAKSGKLSKDFKTDLNNIFGDELDSVIDDLSNGVDSDNVKLLMLNQMSKFQPVTLLQVPQAYLDMPRGRIAYALKTYQINQLNAILDEAKRGMATATTQKDFKEAALRVATLMAFLVACGIGTDAFKDYLFRRKANFGEYLTDNMLKLALISRYTTWKFRTDGVKNTILNMVSPQVSWIDYIGKDIVKMQKAAATPGPNDFAWKDLQSIRVLPVVGQEFYWWYGGGHESVLKREKRNAPPAEFKRNIIRQRRIIRNYIQAGDTKNADKQKEVLKKMIIEGTPKVKEYYEKELKKEYPRSFEVIKKLQDSENRIDRARSKMRINKLTSGQQRLYGQYVKELQESNK